MSAGAVLLNEQKELLVVKPSYKEHWTLPGGIVEEFESPRVGCAREVLEEVGINLDKFTLLCVDYKKIPGEEDESLQFVFYGGVLNASQAIHIDGKEIIEYKFAPRDEAIQLLGGLERPLGRRISKCLDALDKGTIVYLENTE